LPRESLSLAKGVILCWQGKTPTLAREHYGYKDIKNYNADIICPNKGLQNSI